ncbi:MAG: hypothetical protein KC645_14275, partial [Gemmatimonadetes bacterium]|nr:hypothetical protein [Gemmatimonadota bacterium]
MKRTWVVLALWVAGALPVPLAAQEIAEATAIEVSLGRLVSRTLLGYRLGERALLPVGEIAELAELRVQPDGPALRIVREPEGTELRVDPRTGRLSTETDSWTLASGTFVLSQGEIYLTTEDLGRLLDVEWLVSWRDLAVTVVDPSDLPIGRRVAREWQRRVRLVQGLEIDPSVPLLPLERQALDGLVVDYGVFAPAGSSFEDAAYSLAAGIELLGGSLTTAWQNRSGSDTAERWDAAWSTIWTDRSWITHTRLGDGIGTGPRPRTVRGLSFGNAPYLRPNDVGEVAFTGSLGPGWQVEAYRGGRLIAFDSADALGRYSIDAPIAYGENPVEFVAYGPFGEVRRFSRTHRVDGTRIPARQLEYGVSVGACRTDRCDATANADLRYGLSTRWTARAGVDQFWRGDSLPSLFHPYAGIAGMLGNSVGVEAEVVADAVTRATLRFEPSPDVVLQAEGTRFAQGVVDPLLTPPGRTEQVTVSGLWRPDGRLAGWYVEGSLDHYRSERSQTTGGRLGGALQLDELQLFPAVRWQATRLDGLTLEQRSAELTATLLPLAGLGPWFGQVTARTYLEVDLERGVSVVDARVGRMLDRALRMEVGGGWRRFQGPMVSLNLAANFSSVRGLFSVDRRSGATTTTQYVQGSVLYNPVSGRFQPSAGPALERAGVTGRVFLDGNGNQRFDEGEQLLPNVRVSV